MLKLDQLSFAYEQEEVICDLSMELSKGAIHGLLGPNGSGKTTLLNLVAGRLKPDEGEVRWMEKAVTASTAAYLRSEPYFYPLSTGREHLALFSHRNPGFRVERWNELFRLPLDDLIETYSSGMKKKLALMGVVALDRPLLLLDEPFNNLDLESNQLIGRMLELLAEKGTLVILTSHILEILTAMCGSIHVMQEGRIGESVENEFFGEWKEGYRKQDLEEASRKLRSLL
ncbi:MAG: ABC transporter ATP-binding protein [Balneolaceae bacterium]|nr:ABC transporter ATP-binding protein [Balneolaceae bacterium]